MGITGVGSSYNFVYNTKTGKLSTKDGSKNEFVDFCNGDVYVCLNNDVEVIEPEWLTRLVEKAIRKDVGVEIGRASCRERV